jgi:hypothetical protein
MPAIDIIPDGTLVETVGSPADELGVYPRGIRLFVAGAIQARTIDGAVYYQLSVLPDGSCPIEGSFHYRTIQRVPTEPTCTMREISDRLREALRLTLGDDAF